ncbi:condensation domain-containing protein [Burkholderia perseverans]|uniref:condensation domain-containing protein n=1 Tax=Burkholderia perseverans TaxID=2615214 RepID=UPI001FEE8942|nr:condensation domain-containing protein [Burkholderia perseverans]
MQTAYDVRHPDVGVTGLCLDDLFDIEDALGGDATTAVETPNGLLAALRAIAPSVESVTPLAPSQRDLYLHACRDPDNLTYILAYALALRADVDVDVGAWRAALRAAERRAPTFRSRYVEVRQALLQIVDTKAVAPLEVIRVADAAEAATAIEAARSRPFELFDGAVRHLLLLGDGFATAVLVAHHIAIDTMSAALFFGEVFAASGAAEASGAGSTGAGIDERFTEWAGRAAATVDSAAAIAACRGAFAGARALLPVALAGDETRNHVRLDTGSVRVLARWCAQNKLQLAAALKYAAARVLAEQFSPGADFVVYDVISDRSLRHMTSIGCHYRMLPLVLTREMLAGTDPRSDAASFQRYLRDETARLPVSMLAVSTLSGERGAPVFFNYFDYAAMAPLLELPDTAHPGMRPARFDVYDRIDDGETHLLFYREHDGFGITVRSRHPAMAGRAMAEAIAARVMSWAGGAPA